MLGIAVPREDGLVQANQAKGRRDDHRVATLGLVCGQVGVYVRAQRRVAARVGPDVDARIVEARAVLGLGCPRCVFLDLFFRDSGRQRDDGARHEVAVGPAVQPLVHDAAQIDLGTCNRQVQVAADGGVAQRAGDAKLVQVQAAVGAGADLALGANNRIQAQQGQCGLWIIQRDAAVQYTLDHFFGQGSRIDLEANACCSEGVNRLLNHLIHLQHVGPECLIAKGVVAENVLAVSNQLGIKRHLGHLHLAGPITAAARAEDQHAGGKGTHDERPPKRAS